MWNKMYLIGGGGVLTDDRYTMVWLPQAWLFYLYLAWQGQEANQIWLANIFVYSLIMKIQGIDYAVVLQVILVTVIK